MKPWKRAEATDWLGNVDQLQWGHGDEAVEEAEDDGMVDFKNIPLQWGHGDEAVEEAGSESSGGRGGEASMGPRR